MSVLKKLRVILLPTNKRSHLLKVATDKMNYRNRMKGNLEYHDSPWNTSKDFEANHLYIVSDEQIVEGDIALLDWEGNNNIDDTRIGIVECSNPNTLRIKNQFGNISEWKSDNYWKNAKMYRVIASTDKSLMLRFKDGSGSYTCPQLRQSFIEKYILAYNAGHAIEWVNVEYDEFRHLQGVDIDDNSKINYEIEHKLKLRSDNTIIIHAIKDSFSREEVKAIIKANTERLTNSWLSHDIDWFEENY